MRLERAKTFLTVKTKERAERKYTQKNNILHMTHKSFDSLLMLSFNTALRNSAVIWSSKWGFQYMHLMIKQCQYSYMMTTNIIRLACAVFVFEHFHAPSILKDCWFSWGKKGHISLISVELFGMLIVMCWSKCCFINNSGVLRAVTCGSLSSSLHISLMAAHAWWILS